MSQFCPGDMVLFIGDEAARMHCNSPKFYPHVGTVGVVIEAAGTPFDGLVEAGDGVCLVQWHGGGVEEPGHWLTFDKTLASYSEGEGSA